MRHFPRLASLLGRGPSAAPAALAMTALDTLHGDANTGVLMLAARVEAALSDDAALARALIRVETGGGVVTLRGFVDSPMDMLRALELVGGMDGVESITNQLQLAWW